MVPTLFGYIDTGLQNTAVVVVFFCLLVLAYLARWQEPECEWCPRPPAI